MKIDLSALRKPIKAQLNEQGIEFEKPFIDHLEADAIAICRLSVRGLLSNSESTKAHRRLIKKIKSNLKFAKHPMP